MLFIVVSLVWGWVIIVVMAIVVAPPLDTLYIIFRGGKCLSVSRSGNQTVGDFKGTSALKHETEERKCRKSVSLIYMWTKRIENYTKQNCIFVRVCRIFVHWTICTTYTLVPDSCSAWNKFMSLNFISHQLHFLVFAESNLSSLNYVFNGYYCILCMIVWACVGCKNLCVSDWFSCSTPVWWPA